LAEVVMDLAARSRALQLRKQSIRTHLETQ
jgi:hypothetical protein